MLLSRHLLPFEIVKFDVEKDEPYRTKEGFCIKVRSLLLLTHLKKNKVATGEPGELIGKVTDKSPFIGYHRDEKANNKKLLRDVFEKGDVYYRSGDLIKLDSQGYMFFVDRIGDTYRWKSENVATNEVMETMTSFPGGGVLEANVYGIQIPGIDGRAGMAAVLLRDDVHLGKLGEYLSAQLPHYAVPLFLRLLPKQDNKGMELTATFKYQKFSLREQGANPSIVKEPIVAFNPKTKSYEPFGQKVIQAFPDETTKIAIACFFLFLNPARTMTRWSAARPVSNPSPSFFSQFFTLSCPFSCCAVRASSSSLPAELTRPFFLCTSSTDPTHSLDCSIAFPVQSLQQTEFIRHIFFNPISFFYFFLSLQFFITGAVD